MSALDYPRWLAVPVLALVGTGCGELRERSVPTAAERAALDELVGQVLTVPELIGLPARADGDGAALLAAVRIDPVAALLAPQAVRLPRLAGEGGLAECATSGGAVASFTACELGGHTLDGTVARTAGWVRADLTDVFVTDDGYEGAVTLEGSLLRRPGTRTTSLDGALALYAVWTASDGAEGLLEATLTWDRLVVSGAGCAVGGSLQITGSVTEAQSHAPVSRTISFGPECGDLSILP